MFRMMNFLNIDYSKDDNILNEELESEKFNQLKQEYNQENNIDKKQIIDNNTNLQMKNFNIGLKNFDVYATMVNCEQLKNISYNKDLFLLKFKRKNDKHIMSQKDLEEYVKINNGEVKFLKAVTPEQICKIAKTLNNEFYFVANCYDNVIPMSKFQAQQIFAKNNNVVLNENLHIKKITSREAGQELKTNNLSDLFIHWFNNNVRHAHPYAYSDMVITEQVKHYKFLKKDKNGKYVNVKSQFSNELTNKYLTENNVYKLHDFVIKCQKMHNKARTLHEEHVFALPFPLYSKEHMLSVILCFKPNGKINITVVNANGLKKAKDEYAIPIGNIIQKAFEKYSTTLPAQTSYFFHENNSQYGGTCMTHADCITKQLVKDPEFEKDGHDLHPIKIWEKAYIRGFAVTLYQQALRQGKFISDNIKEVRQCNDKAINNNLNIDKTTRDFTIKCENNTYIHDHKSNNLLINTNKNDRNAVISQQQNTNHAYINDKENLIEYNATKNKDDYLINNDLTIQ